MTGALPTFSIIIPTYNRADVLARTLRHLADMDYPDDLYEVIAVDNSSDASPDVVEQAARTERCTIKLIRSRHRLPAIKRNEGLALATGDYALFLNDDLWVEPNFLREHARTHAMYAGEPVAVIGYVEQSPEMPYTPFLEAYLPFAYYEIADHADKPVSYRYFWSMNLSLPRQEMLDRGLVFHEDWGEIGHEDVELGYRWTKAGRRVIYNPQARGDHYHPHTLESACRLQESIGRGLRDLERLIPEPDLLERYGVFTWHNSPRGVARGLVRQALFNEVTIPFMKRWLDRQTRNSPLTRWLYWKIMLHYTNRGYRQTAPRFPQPLEIRPAASYGGATTTPATEG